MACGGGGAATAPDGGLMPVVAAVPMGRLGFWALGDCSPPVVEEVGGGGRGEGPVWDQWQVGGDVMRRGRDGTASTTGGGRGQQGGE
jgi:hypothetical protein